MSAKKIVSVVTTACFLVSFVFGQAAHAAVEAFSPRTAPAVADTGIIPSRAGKIIEGMDYGNGRLAVIVQDLHCHPEVQRNIAQILASLDGKYQLEKVYVEGGYGAIDTSWLGGIEDVALKNEIAEAMLNQGKLAGCEYYSVQAGKPRLLQGIEDETIHKENIVRLGKILENQPLFEQKAGLLARELSLMQARYFSGDNKRFNVAIQNHRKGKISSEKYYRLLAKYADAINRSPRRYTGLMSIHWEDYPNLAAFLEINRISKDLSVKKVSRQMQFLSAELRARLPYAAFASLMKDTENFSRTEVLISALSRLNKEYSLNIGTAYPDVQKYLDYTEKSRSINPVGLLREEKGLVAAIRIGLSRTSGELDVSFLSDFFNHFEDYLMNRLTAEEYAYFQSRFEKFQALWTRYAFRDHLPELASYFPLLNDFYRVNCERNTCFIRNVDVFHDARTVPSARGTPIKPEDCLQLIGKSRTAVMVTGGFHAEGLKKLLGERGVSYVTIMPSVTGDTAISSKVYREMAIFESRLLATAMHLGYISQLSSPALCEQAITAVNKELREKKISDRIELLNKIRERFDAGAVLENNVIRFSNGARIALDENEGTLQARILNIGKGLSEAFNASIDGLVNNYSFAHALGLAMLGEPAMLIIHISEWFSHQERVFGDGLSYQIFSDPVFQSSEKIYDIERETLSCFPEPVMRAVLNYHKTQKYILLDDIGWLRILMAIDILREPILSAFDLPDSRNSNESGTIAGHANPVYPYVMDWRHPLLSLRSALIRGMIYIREGSHVAVARRFKMGDKDKKTPFVQIGDNWGRVLVDVNGESREEKAKFFVVDPVLSSILAGASVFAGAFLMFGGVVPGLIAGAIVSGMLMYVGSHQTGERVQSLIASELILLYIFCASFALNNSSPAASMIGPMFLSAIAFIIAYYWGVSATVGSFSDWVNYYGSKKGYLDHAKVLEGFAFSAPNSGYENDIQTFNEILKGFEGMVAQDLFLCRNTYQLMRFSSREEENCFFELIKSLQPASLSGDLNRVMPPKVFNSEMKWAYALKDFLDTAGPENRMLARDITDIILRRSINHSLRLASREEYERWILTVVIWHIIFSSCAGSAAEERNTERHNDECHHLLNSLISRAAQNGTRDIVSQSVWVYLLLGDIDVDEIYGLLDKEYKYVQFQSDKSHAARVYPEYLISLAKSVPDGGLKTLKDKLLFLETIQGEPVPLYPGTRMGGGQLTGHADKVYEYEKDWHNILGWLRSKLYTEMLRIRESSHWWVARILNLPCIHYEFSDIDSLHITVDPEGREKWEKIAFVGIDQLVSGIVSGAFIAAGLIVVSGTVTVPLIIGAGVIGALWIVGYAYYGIPGRWLGTETRQPLMAGFALILAASSYLVFNGDVSNMFLGKIIAASALFVVGYYWGVSATQGSRSDWRTLFLIIKNLQDGLLTAHADSIYNTPGNSAHEEQAEADRIKTLALFRHPVVMRAASFLPDIDMKHIIERISDRPGGVRNITDKEIVKLLAEEYGEELTANPEYKRLLDRVKMNPLIRMAGPVLGEDEMGFLNALLLSGVTPAADGSIPVKETLALLDSMVDPEITSHFIAQYEKYDWDNSIGIAWYVETWDSIDLVYLKKDEKGNTWKVVPLKMSEDDDDVMEKLDKMPGRFEIITSFDDVDISGSIPGDVAFEEAGLPGQKAEDTNRQRTDAKISDASLQKDMMTFRDILKGFDGLREDPEAYCLVLFTSMAKDLSQKEKECFFELLKKLQDEQLSSELGMDFPPDIFQGMKWARALKEYLDTADPAHYGNARDIIRELMMSAGTGQEAGKTDPESIISKRIIVLAVWNIIFSFLVTAEPDEKKEAAKSENTGISSRILNGLISEGREKLLLDYSYSCLWVAILTGETSGLSLKDYLVKKYNRRGEQMYEEFRTRKTEDNGYFNICENAAKNGGLNTPSDVLSFMEDILENKELTEILGSRAPVAQNAAAHTADSKTKVEMAQPQEYRNDGNALAKALRQYDEWYGNEKLSLQNMYLNMRFSSRQEEQRFLDLVEALSPKSLFNSFQGLMPAKVFHNKSRWDWALQRYLETARLENGATAGRICNILFQNTIRHARHGDMSGYPVKNCGNGLLTVAVWDIADSVLLNAIDVDQARVEAESRKKRLQLLDTLRRDMEMKRQDESRYQSAWIFVLTASVNNEDLQGYLNRLYYMVLRDYNFHGRKLAAAGYEKYFKYLGDTVAKGGLQTLDDKRAFMKVIQGGQGLLSLAQAGRKSDGSVIAHADMTKYPYVMNARYPLMSLRSIMVWIAVWFAENSHSAIADLLGMEVKKKIISKNEGEVQAEIPIPSQRGRVIRLIGEDNAKMVFVAAHSLVAVLIGGLLIGADVYLGNLVLTSTALGIQAAALIGIALSSLQAYYFFDSSFEGSFDDMETLKAIRSGKHASRLVTGRLNYTGRHLNKLTPDELRTALENAIEDAIERLIRDTVHEKLDEIEITALATLTLEHEVDHLIQDTRGIHTAPDDIKEMFRREAAREIIRQKLGWTDKDIKVKILDIAEEKLNEKELAMDEAERKLAESERSLLRRATAQEIEAFDQALKIFASLSENDRDTCRNIFKLREFSSPETMQRMNGLLQALHPSSLSTDIRSVRPPRVFDPEMKWVHALQEFIDAANPRDYFPAILIINIVMEQEIRNARSEDRGSAQIRAIQRQIMMFAVWSIIVSVLGEPEYSENGALALLKKKWHFMLEGIINEALKDSTTRSVAAWSGWVCLVAGDRGKAMALQKICEDEYGWIPYIDKAFPDHAGQNYLVYLVKWYKRGWPKNAAEMLEFIAGIQGKPLPLKLPGTDKNNALVLPENRFRVWQGILEGKSIWMLAKETALLERWPSLNPFSFLNRHDERMPLHPLGVALVSLGNYLPALVGYSIPLLWGAPSLNVLSGALAVAGLLAGVWRGGVSVHWVWNYFTLSHAKKEVGVVCHVARFGDIREIMARFNVRGVWYTELPEEIPAATALNWITRIPCRSEQGADLGDINVWSCPSDKPLVYYFDLNAVEKPLRDSALRYCAAKVTAQWSGQNGLPGHPRDQKLFFGRYAAYDGGVTMKAEMLVDHTGNLDELRRRAALWGLTDTYYASPAEFAGVHRDRMTAAIEEKMARHHAESAMFRKNKIFKINVEDPSLLGKECELAYAQKITEVMVDWHLLNVKGTTGENRLREQLGEIRHANGTLVHCAFTMSKETTVKDVEKLADLGFQGIYLDIHCFDDDPARGKQFLNRIKHLPIIAVDAPAGVTSRFPVKKINLDEVRPGNIGPDDVVVLSIPEEMGYREMEPYLKELPFRNTIIFDARERVEAAEGKEDIIDKVAAIVSDFDNMVCFGRKEIRTKEDARRLAYSCVLNDVSEMDNSIRDLEPGLRDAYDEAIDERFAVMAYLETESRQIAAEYARGTFTFSNPRYEEMLGRFLAKKTVMPAAKNEWKAAAKSMEGKTVSEMLRLYDDVMNGSDPQMIHALALVRFLTIDALADYHLKKGIGARSPAMDAQKLRMVLAAA